MPDFTHKRFDDRILDREDDGRAFERFVDEFLRQQEPDAAMVRGLAKGPDGAIDLSDRDGPITRIVECKFIGAQSKDKAADRWGEVRSTLGNNLPPLAAGDDKGRGKYRPWLRSQGNLSTYTFVTSAIAASTDERAALQRAIEEFFADLSGRHPDLNHLRHLKVELRYWDDLIGQAASLPQLFYRWFGELPYGYGDIALSFGSEAGFKRFLESRHLPYFSRDAYLAETGGKKMSHFESTLDHLTKGNGPRTGVISGPGGVGKTRLAIELCEAARQRDWWPVRLDRKAQATDLTKLCQSHATGARLLLFVDYAETCDDLEGFATEMGRLALEGGHRLSLLASTRASSIQQVLDRLSALPPEETVLDPEADPAFDAWVVRKILAHFAVPDAEAVAKSCSGLPVMAAFAGFLLQSDKAQFEKQFGNLVAVKDFADWSARRLQAIEDRFRGQLVQRLLAELAVRLPMPETEVEAFRAASEVHDQLFAVLRADHWIEPEGAGFAAAHDVLADAMLARHLSAMPKDEQVRLQALLIAALAEGRLDRCLAAVDRLGAHPVFAKLSGRKAVEALLRRDRERTLAALPMLAQSRLLPPSDLIALLFQHWQSDKAVYLTKALSMAHDLSPKGVACIIAWAGTHPESEDAIFRLSRVSNRLANLPLNDSFRALIACSVEAVLGKLLVATQVSENEQQATSSLLASLSHINVARNRHWVETLEHFCACLRHGGLLRYHEGLPCDRFTLLLHDTLALRLLDPLADACAIRHAHDLIRRGVPPSEYAQLIARGYLPPPPSEDR